MSAADIHLMREWGYICEDPACTATHVDAESLSEAPLFIEDAHIIRGEN